MKSCIVTYIAACTNPSADEIRYHPTCWRKYIHPTSDDYNSSPYQNVQRMEIDQLMFIHVRKVIFQDNESRTSKGLSDDYNHLLSNHNFPKCKRMSKLKSIIEKEFGDAVGFHNWFQKNQSSIVYDVSKGGSYIEAAINAWGISDDYYAMLLVVWEIKQILQTLHSHHIQSIWIICLICQKNCWSSMYY